MKPATGPGSNANPVAKQKEKKKEVPTLMEFIDGRDYTGAITLLEVNNSYFFNSIVGSLDVKIRYTTLLCSVRYETVGSFVWFFISISIL